MTTSVQTTGVVSGKPDIMTRNASVKPSERELTLLNTKHPILASAINASTQDIHQLMNLTSVLAQNENHHRTTDTKVVGAPIFGGQVATQSAIENSVSPDVRMERHRGITVLTKKGGDATLIKKAIDILPAKMLTSFADNNIKLVAVKDSVTEHFPDLIGTPRGYLPGTDFSKAPGVFKSNTVVITTSGANPSPSVNVTLHELGHAYDKINGYISRKAEFRSISSSVLPGSRYFSQPGIGGTSESFAESFAQYYTGYTKINPNVKEYWEKQ